jgi:small GTP-binding protein
MYIRMRTKEKVVLLGDGAVGKTSLVRRFVVDQFSDSYIATIGSKVMTRTVDLYGNTMTLVIWDVLGQHGYTTIQRNSLHGATGALIVMDLTRKETMLGLMGYWIPKLREMAGDIPLVLVGNKADLPKDPSLSEWEFMHLSRDYRAPFVLTSAKTGQNVEKSFHMLGQAILLHINKRPPSIENAGPRERAGTAIAAADYIMSDFCSGFGDEKLAMAIVRQHFAMNGVNVLQPTVEELRRVVSVLEEVEANYLGAEVARRKRYARQGLLSTVC